MKVFCGASACPQAPTPHRHSTFIRALSRRSGDVARPPARTCKHIFRHRGREVVGEQRHGWVGSGSAERALSPAPSEKFGSRRSPGAHIPASAVLGNGLWGRERFSARLSRAPLLAPPGPFARFPPGAPPTGRAATGPKNAKGALLDPPSPASCLSAWPARSLGTRVPGPWGRSRREGGCL